MKIKFILAILTIILYVNNSVAQNTKIRQAELTIQTSGHCGECKVTIEKTMAFEKGVKEASLDFATGILSVTYNPQKTNADKLRHAISNVGYDADSIPADLKAYAKLKACCKKEGKDLMK